jgi:hypothetical protein
VDNVSEGEEWVKINIDRKRSSYIEKEYFEESQNCCSTGDRTAELNIHHEGTVSIKTVQRELHKCNIHSRAAIVKPLITESNAQMRKRWCHDHKTLTPDNWKRFTLFPTSTKKSLHLENIQGSI